MRRAELPSGHIPEGAVIAGGLLLTGLALREFHNRREQRKIKVSQENQRITEENTIFENSLNSGNFGGDFTRIH